MRRKVGGRTLVLAARAPDGKTALAKAQLIVKRRVCR